MCDPTGRVTADQPMPTRGAVDVTPIARDLFLRMLLRREAKGIATYGTTLRSENGRDAVRDALEELIDAWQYLVQIGLERDALLGRVRAAEAERDEARRALARYTSGPTGAPPTEPNPHREERP